MHKVRVSLEVLRAWARAKPAGDVKGVVLKMSVAVLASLFVVTSILAVYWYNNAQSLQNLMEDRDSELVTRGQALTWLDPALNLIQLAHEIQLPNASRYLTTMSSSTQQGEPTKIYLVSTATGYSYDPYTWPFTPELRSHLTVNTDNGSIRLPDFGWSYLPGNYSYGIFGGNPIFLVGVTVRNDYNPADTEKGNGSEAPISTNPYTNKSSSWIMLTARFYDQNGDVVDLAGANVTYAQAAVRNQKFSLGSGETTQVVFYFSPPRREIESYEVYVSYLSANW